MTTKQEAILSEEDTVKIAEYIALTPTYTPLTEYNKEPDADTNETITTEDYNPDQDRPY